MTAIGKKLVGGPALNFANSYPAQTVVSVLIHP